MSHGPTIVPSKGACIYCGSRDVRLTDEHFLPLSLGGRHVIAKASCDNCADITKKFEQAVAREMWGDARIAYDAPSRRKSRRATHLLVVDAERTDRRVKVPYSDYPAAMVFYKMHRAGFLEGLPAALDTSSAWQFSVVMDEKRHAAFEAKYAFKPTVRFRHVPDSFGRLLAKIGYGQVLSSLDPSDFHEVCVQYILGKKHNLSYIVGGTHDVPTPEQLGYVLRTLAFGTPDRLLLIAEVRLFANLHSPQYHVVVGEVRGHEGVASVLEKLDGDAEIFVGTARAIAEGQKSVHWFPQKWPLPPLM